MNKQYGNLPDIVEKDESEIKYIISLLKDSNLPDDVKTFVIKCVELALWFPLFLQKKNISLHRLRVIIFGKGYNKKNNNAPPNNNDKASNTKTTADTTTGLSEKFSQNELVSGTSNLLTNTATTSIIITKDIGNIEVTTDAASEDASNKKPGHGRMPHTVYENYTEIQLLLNLTAGDSCPTECGGKLSSYKAGIIVRVKGQNFAQIYVYSVNKLRCNLCGTIVQAPIPTEVGTEKYDPSFKAMLALMKYYIGIPFYRQENFQKMLGFPLPDSTQWMIIEQLAGFCYATYNQSKYYAANGTIMQNDDTTLKILEVINQVKKGTAGERSGMYTTGIISNYEGHQIALFINGRQHSGENVSDILKFRDSDREHIIQMCDALNANVSKTTKTILCNCLAHGFRKFVELVNFFGDECAIIIEKLSQVFKYDAKTRTMSAETRLEYHIKNSQPIMTELAQYMTGLIDEHLVEPNSELGKSIKYMQRHWIKLTRFLTVAGAPIDNNIVERALKIAIRNRKSAMFYKTTYSAGIGGMLTSLIYTCHLNKQNPHDYLIALQVHQPMVLANPAQWMPWNYLETIANLATSAIPEAHSPPVDYPAVA